MLIDDIKKRMREALKAGRSLEKEILRVAIGEIETNAARPGKEHGDAESQAVIRKLLKSNEETLAVVSDEAQRRTLEQENEILKSLLPRSLDSAEIRAALAAVADQIRAAKSDGQATGIAMKELKSKGAHVDGKDVAAAVAELRATTS